MHRICLLLCLWLPSPAWSDVQLNGDHDVFGDGKVMIISAPGHTPGHQALPVRLKKPGLFCCPVITITFVSRAN